MRYLSKLVYALFFVFLFLILPFSFLVVNIQAQEPIPELLLSCSETRPNEFHSLRPYQAAPCGNAPQALFCSNKLVIFESFELAHKCQSYREYETGTRYCEPNYHVNAHDLNITLDESEFPIMGNTEDEFDDATKLSEYASWYLNGVIDKRENKDATDEQIVNFSGPVRKLIPFIIQDQQRIKIIESTKSVGVQVGGPAPNPLEVDESTEGQPDNHDQLVVDNERLSSWDGDLSFFRIGALAWDKRIPPLPWSDENEEPFESDVLYRKAYNEWLGKSCLILPIIGLQCVDIKIPTLLGSFDVISNKYADLWHFVPLSNNSDQKGKNYLLTGDGPSYVPSKRTEIDNAQHKSYKNAPLYFAHTKEVFDLSQLLNQTYRPADYESEKLPETTEQIKKGVSTKTQNILEPLPAPVPQTGNSPAQTAPIPIPAPVPSSRDPYASLDCSAVNVRVNEGDNLFPGDRNDGKELYVEDAEYDITGVECDEVYERVPRDCEVGERPPCFDIEDSFVCNALVGIEFKLGTKTPYANEIFADTVADSGSTFRKIFPKVEKGAPVECIADIPTQTNVTYELDPNLTEKPNGGTQELTQKAYPADGAGDGTMLTFPHIGSVYEYFLKGIQTALRPKGYGEPIANGNCKPTEPVECGDWEEKLEKNSGGDCGICTSELGDLAKRILATAGKQYNVPAANIWAAMLHEGGDWAEFKGQYSDENVRKWSNTEECGGEPMPRCDNSVWSTQPPFGFLENWFYNGDNQDAPWKSVQKIDPSRDSRDKVSRCNFLDAAFAAANLLSQGSTAAANGILSCGTDSSGNPYIFDNTRPGTCSSSYWTPAHIAQSQATYAGQCVDDLSGETKLYSTADTISWFNSAKCN